MRLKVTFWSGAALALFTLAGCSGGEQQQQSEATPSTPEAATQEAPQQADTGQSGRTFTVSLSGKEEVPGPGDEDGGGMAQITLNESAGQLCYELSVQNVDAPTAAHIHTAPAGQSGGVAVPLEAPAQGSASGCVNVDPAVLQQIAQNPANYYVNVHNAAFPAGAVRGQLGQ